jgi:hypothetical protein
MESLLLARRSSGVEINRDDLDDLQLLFDILTHPQCAHAEIDNVRGVVVVYDADEWEHELDRAYAEHHNLVARDARDFYEFRRGLLDGQ